MKIATIPPFLLALPLVLSPLAGLGTCGPTSPDGAVPWALREEGWRTDAAWYDGQAEKCVYEASRRIYGVARTYLATAYTNKQQMDPRTSVKATGEGVEVFKHHWSERAPTESYDYDFSTAVFVRTADLSPFKLTVATQEDCGASFKQVWDQDGELRYLESVYFPGAGMSEGECDRGSHLTDALPLVLRDFPFDSAMGTRKAFELVPSQKDTHAVPFESEPCTVKLAGRETLSLPVGDVDAFRLELSMRDGSVRATYWFAADGTAPWLHALLQYEDVHGTHYRLRSIERTAYWERG